jgi:hypothetical protein
VTANGRHIHRSGRRGTPAEWVEMSRTALGGSIELDPMSEPCFNAIVRAERIYTEQDDCFTLLWRARSLFLNPDGNVVRGAWRKLTMEIRLGHVCAAIWIGFSMEQLSLLADEIAHPLDFSLLVARQRIDFLTTEPMRAIARVAGAEAELKCGHSVKISAKKHQDAKELRCPNCEGVPEPLGSPTHANYVVGLGVPIDRFETAFAGRGRFSHGRLAVERASLPAEEVFGGVA